MNPDKPQTTGRFLTSALSAAVVLLLAVVGAAYFFQQKASEAIGWRTHTDEVLVELNALRADVMELSSGLRGYAISGKDDWLEPYLDARRDGPERVRLLRNLTADNPAQQRRLDLFNEHLEAWLAIASKRLALAEEKGLEAMRQEIATGTGRAVLGKMETILADMVAEEHRLHTIRNAAVERNTSLATAVTVLGNLLALAVVTWVGLALNRTIARLRKAAAETEETAWLKSNLASATRKLQGQRDLQQVCQMALSDLAPLVGAQHGAFYLTQPVGDRIALRLLASYAMQECKHLANEIKPGEGLVGQCLLEKERILLTEVPADYIKIGSGLGEAKPLNLVVLPVLFEGQVRAVIELASLHRFSDIHLAFLDQLMEGLGVVINTIQASTRTEELLTESQSLAGELKTRQTELEETNTRLEEQTKTLQASEEQLQAQQGELKETNEELEHRADALTQQKRQIEAKTAEVEQARAGLQLKAEELALTSKYKSEFLANMSHELRTPLNSLLILSQTLSNNSEKNLNDKQVEWAKAIHGSGTDLLELINEILDLSKIESGKMDVEVGDCPLADVGAFSERTFRHMAEKKGLRFDLELDPLLPAALRTDARRLEQVMKNLLSNAFKFTEKGGVTLAIAPARQGWGPAHTRLNQARQVIAFAVRDTGIGIPKEKQQIIFEAFQQADAGTARNYGGTGLGLSISREIARLLGGTIHVESEPGAGSPFTLYLPDEWTPLPPAAREENTHAVALASPAAPESQPRPEPEAAAIPDDRATLRPGERSTLIIEDDLRFARILQETAREAGFKTLVAPDAARGLALARAHVPTAITLDLRLPDGSGWTVLDRLKHDPATRHIPVHVISVEEEQARGRHEGAFGFLTKPVTREALDAAFQRLRDFTGRARHTVLVVEDDETERKALLELIGNGDVQATAADSAETALALLAQEPFDCVVLDLRLPGKSGFEVMDKMQADPALQRIPVIVHTGKELTAGERAHLQRRAADTILKDAGSPERLLDQVSLFLHRTLAGLPEAKRRMIAESQTHDRTLADRTVLIVDDDMRNIFALTSVLEGSQMRVLHAESGAEAIALLEKEPSVELVLMDVMMPEMDGLEATRRIRTRQQWKKLPILALTAKAMKGDREQCLAAGCSDYVTKPVDIDQLRSLLRVWLYKP